MRGINRVIFSGEVCNSNRIDYSETDSGSPVCSFVVASSRPGINGTTVTSYAKINAYGSGLVGVCSKRLRSGVYVLVEGELMNRDGARGEFTEVRARDLIFLENWTPEGT